MPCSFPFGSYFFCKKFPLLNSLPANYRYTNLFLRNRIVLAPGSVLASKHLFWYVTLTIKNKNSIIFTMKKKNKTKLSKEKKNRKLKKQPSRFTLLNLSNVVNTYSNFSISCTIDNNYRSVISRSPAHVKNNNEDN